MKDWIKNTGYFLLAFGIFGVFKNNNFATPEEIVGLIISNIFIIIALIIEFFTWREKKSKVSKS